MLGCIKFVYAFSTRIGFAPPGVTVGFLRECVKASELNDSPDQAASARETAARSEEQHGSVPWSPAAELTARAAVVPATYLYYY